MEPPTIILRRKPTKEELARSGRTETVKKTQPSGNNQGYYDPSAQRKLDIDDIPFVPTTNVDIGKTIMQARNAIKDADGKGMSMADLAKKCNLSVSIIQAYESGKSDVPMKQAEVDLINRALGTKIKIPKAPKPQKA